MKRDQQLQEIEALESQILKDSLRLKELKQAVTPIPVKDYVLKNIGGDILLSELFLDKQKLLIIHNMGSFCPYCTMWADNINGILPSLSKDISVILLNGDSPEKQAEFAKARGWGFSMVNDEDLKLASDFGFCEKSEKGNSLNPGFSPLWRNSNGDIMRGASSQFGPFDLYCSFWHLSHSFPVMEEK